MQAWTHPWPVLGPAVSGLCAAIWWWWSGRTVFVVPGVPAPGGVGQGGVVAREGVDAAVC